MSTESFGSQSQGGDGGGLIMQGFLSHGEVFASNSELNKELLEDFE